MRSSVRFLSTAWRSDGESRAALGRARLDMGEPATSGLRRVTSEEGDLGDLGVRNFPLEPRDDVDGGDLGGDLACFVFLGVAFSGAETESPPVGCGGVSAGETSSIGR